MKDRFVVRATLPNGKPLTSKLMDYEEAQSLQADLAGGLFFVEIIFVCSE